jgi:hypothetical protein
VIRPGLLTARDADELNRRLLRLETYLVEAVVPPLTVTRTPGGQVIGPGSEAGAFWAKITEVGSTGTNTGCGIAHAWEEWWDDHATACLIKREGGRSGTTTERPAREVLKRTAVKGDLVWLHPPTRGRPDHHFLLTTGLVMGKLDGALVYQGSAIMSVWAWTGSADADTGENVAVFDWLLASGQSIAAGKNVVAAFVGGRLRVIGAQC